MNIAPVEQRRIQIGNATIAFQVLGDGPAVVLLHGLSGSTRWWRYNTQALAQHFRVYIVDLLGFGASRGARFVLHDAAAHLAAWMDQLGIGRASLIGHSMGGHIVADVAAEHPQHVERLVLVDAAVLPFERGYRQYARGLARELRQVRLNFLPVLLADALRAGPITLLRSANQILHADLRTKLEHISAPTLLVWGERDALVPLSFGRALQAAMPASALLVVARVGHNVMWDCPSAFNREVTAFLRGSGPTPGERLVKCW